MNKIKKGLSATIAMFGLAALTIPCPAEAQGPGLKRTDLQQHDISIPGREVVQARVEISPGTAPIRHKHPGEEIIYVLEGIFEYEVEGKKTVTLKAGDVLFIPTGTIHSAKNVGKGIAVELATYILEKGKTAFVKVD